MSRTAQTSAGKEIKDMTYIIPAAKIEGKVDGDRFNAVGGGGLLHALGDPLFFKYSAPHSLCGVGGLFCERSIVCIYLVRILTLSVSL